MPAAPIRPVALIPAFRCESSVRLVVSGVRPFVDEVVVVDDGSPDGTAGAAESAGARVLRRAVNGGKGTALRDGLAAVLPGGFTHVAFVDGDGQHDPADLPRLLAAAEEGADFVIGSRLGRPEGMPARSYWANTIGDRVLSRMTGLPVEDGQSGYRVIAAELLRPLRLVSRRFAIENEILVKAAPRVRKLAIVPVRTIYGAGGSHYRPFHDTWITSWLTVWYKTMGGE
ncbi:MAG: glycosyltransferase family 2 protein [Thermoanaerobaculia bacterium]